MTKQPGMIVERSDKECLVFAGSSVWEGGGQMGSVHDVCLPEIAGVGGFETAALGLAACWAGRSMGFDVAIKRALTWRAFSEQIVTAQMLDDRVGAQARMIFEDIVDNGSEVSVDSAERSGILSLLVSEGFDAAAPVVVEPVFDGSITDVFDFSIGKHP